MKYLFTLLLIVTCGTGGFAQEADTIKTHEYATIQANIYYQANTIKYDVKGLHRSPVIVMPDGNAYIAYANVETKEKFVNLSQLLNWMASYGWRMISNHNMPYQGDSGNNSSSTILNTNEYMATMIFERPIRK